MFQDSGATFSRGEARAGDTAEHAAALIDHLERELATTRSDLERTIIQDLEASNEELETSKEEIQAGNEALARAHSTPAVTDIYNLIPGDVGRPLFHITHRAREMPPLPAPRDLRQEIGPVEHELQTLGGRWFLRRVLPYRTHEGRLSGMVVTFTDVTVQKRVMEELAQAVRFSELFVGILSHDLRNPLAAIGLTSPGLLRRPGATPLGHQLRRIEGSAVRMERMIG